MIAFAPPLDQTPTFPTMVLVGTLVTVEAPRTVKLAKSEPSNGDRQYRRGTVKRCDHCQCHQRFMQTDIACIT